MGNSASSLPYTISDETHPPTRPGSYGWALHSGTRKSDSLPVTVFKASKPTLLKTPLNRHDTRDPSQNQFLSAVHHFRKCKTLVHPNILKVYATLDTDHPNGDTPDLTYLNPANPKFDSSIPTTGDLIIVTESATPLQEYLDTLPPSSLHSSSKIAWGLHNLINALAFLHNTAKLAHGAVCPHSIYVTPSGDFKIANFALLTPIGIEDGGGGPNQHFRHFESHVVPREYRSPERVEGRWDAVSTSAVHTMDAFGLGVLIETLYNHPSAGTNGRVPDRLTKAVSRLVTPNIRMRPRVLPLLKCPIFDDPYVHAQDFLDNIAARPVEEKVRFVQGLPDMLTRGVLGREVAVYKVLPVLVGCVTTIAGNEGSMAQDVNRREVLAAVPPLFQIAETHLLTDPEEFRSTIAPIIELLFQINDRGVRGALLARVNVLSTHLDERTLNTNVFEPMCSGFTDSSGALRELTLKSAVALVPHLTPANLEKLVRYLIRLQSDPEPSIRTNTAIFIGKVIPNLTENSRQKLILPAFARAMKDPFTPCRLAALRAVHSCKDYYGPKDVSEKVMPAVVGHLLDGSAEVRTEAFQVVDSFMVTLRMESVKMDEEERRRVAEGGGAEIAGGPGGGGVGAAGGGGVGAADGGGGGGGASAAVDAPSSGSASYLASFGSWAAGKVTTSAQGTMDGGGAGGGGGGSGGAAAAGHVGNLPRSPNPAVPTPTPYAAQQQQHHQQQQQPPAPAFASLSLSDANIGGRGGAIDSGGGGWDDDDDFGGGGGGGGNGPASAAAAPAPSWTQNQEEEEEDFFSSFGAKPSSSAGTGLKIGGLKTASTAAGRAAGGGGSKLVMPSGGKSKASVSEKKAEFARRKAEREKQKAMSAATTKLSPDKGLDDGWDDF